MATHYVTYLYDGNGSYVSNVPGVSSSYYNNSGSYPFTVSKALGNAPTRRYYTFKGWATSSGASSGSAAGSTQTETFVAASVNEIRRTWYATWAHVNVTCHFDANGGSGAPNDIVHWGGYAIDIPDTIPVRSGYNFLGWSLDKNAEFADYAAGQEDAALYDNVMLFAIWEVACSQLDVDDCTLGTVLTIGIERQESSYTDTISYQFGSATGTIATKTNAATVNWTPPLALASQIPSSISGVCILTVSTYDGEDLIGTGTFEIILSVADSQKVSIGSVTLTEAISGLAAKFGAFVQSKSKVIVTVNANTSSAYGATVAEYEININGEVLSENNATTENYLSGSGTIAYSVRVVDTRGKVSDYTGTYNVLSYNPPTVTAIAERDAEVPATINVNYSWSISALSNRNDKTISFKYRPKEEDEYISAGSVTPTAYSGSAVKSIAGTDRAVTNVVQIQISDYFETITFEVEVARYGARVFHVSSEDGTIVIHGYNNADGFDHWREKVLVFEEGLISRKAAVFDDDVSVGGDIVIGTETLTEQTLASLIELLNDTGDVVAEGVIDDGSTVVLDMFEPNGLYEICLMGYNISTNANIGYVKTYLYTFGEDRFDTSILRISRQFSTDTGFYDATYNTGSTLSLRQSGATVGIKYILRRTI